MDKVIIGTKEDGTIYIHSSGEITFMDADLYDKLLGLCEGGKLEVIAFSPDANKG